MEMFEREEIAQNYWNKNWNELKKWQKMEILSYFQLKNRGYNVELMGKCNAGYDLKIVNEDYENGEVRIDVKFSGGNTRRSLNGDFRERIELQFNLGIRRKLEKGKGKTTDYFLLCFYEKKDGRNVMSGYLVPYEKFSKNINILTLTKTRIPNWFEEYKFNYKTMEKIGVKPIQKEKVKV